MRPMTQHRSSVGPRTPAHGDNAERLQPAGCCSLITTNLSKRTAGYADRGLEIQLVNQNRLVAGGGVCIATP
ncbi:hypothetical protein BABINDRAFT_83506 [Babjeviella inositovora NRRL Y-12698]|uniref:Uncharacterized protein n=1 Tax=Babjeviella inositovora NRRL Y-12698 TaxID=984486 RepID=A0A1E3QL34_9ASCO|nr:uncharacterized protein BABINDRAFT_83506 [Babjeviella inositovora NRRL Y-12698]ODQ78406.1 hypothetical protein BABINDRAFT_83506 [Babjeviella inositovora NRRL Y-12698]